jgi:organic hydroperoxide reductase OsmC/OhrA
MPEIRQATEEPHDSARIPQGTRFAATPDMQEFPHRYVVTAAGQAGGDVGLTSPGVPALVTAAPAEFDGPGDRWSPETMLTGSVANCFILTFRAVARAMKLPWDSLSCEVVGMLERVERATQFTRFDVRATLTVLPGADIDLAHRALEKAERSCLVTTSLKAEVHLETKVLLAAGVS